MILAMASTARASRDRDKIFRPKPLKTLKIKQGQDF
jgi:hypothetical protein